MGVGGIELHTPMLQVQLQAGKLADSVDECEALLKRHEAFERLIASQEGKVSKFIHWAAWFDTVGCCRSVT